MSLNVRTSTLTSPEHGAFTIEQFPSDGYPELYVTFDQVVSCSVAPSCKQQHTFRVLHKLTCVTHCFSLRYKIQLELSVDTDQAYICESQNQCECKGGNHRVLRKVPGLTEVPYFDGSATESISYVCWNMPSDISKINIVTHVHCYGYSTGAQMVAEEHFVGHGKLVSTITKNKVVSD